jgi:GxxExxY protein
VRRFRLPPDYLNRSLAAVAAAAPPPPPTSLSPPGDAGGAYTTGPAGGDAPPPADTAPASAAAAAAAAATAVAAASGTTGGPSSASPPEGARSSSFQAYTLDWATLLEAAFAAYAALGDGCSERTYQKKLYYALYCLDIPCIIERPVHTTEHGMTVGKGRVDLEVARRFVLELKVTLPTEKNLRRDTRQLLRYLSTYQEQGHQLERAALVYFANDEVRVVEVSTAPRPRPTFVPRRRHPEDLGLGVVPVVHTKALAPTEPHTGAYAHAHAHA